MVRFEIGYQEIDRQELSARELFAVVPKAICCQ